MEEEEVEEEEVSEEFKPLCFYGLSCPGEVQQQRGSSSGPLWPLKPDRFTSIWQPVDILVVVGLQSQVEVCTKQLLIEGREVSPNDVGVNCSERRQLLRVPTAQRTQR